MSDPEAGEPPQQDDGKPTAAPPAPANKDRLATALRENLRRRKAQRGARKATASAAAARAETDNNADPAAGSEPKK